MNAYFLTLSLLAFLPGPSYKAAPLQCSVMLYSLPERNLVEVTVDRDHKVIIKTPARTREIRNSRVEKEILKLATVSVDEIYEQNKVILFDGIISSDPLLDHRLFVRINDENLIGASVSTRRAHSSVRALLKQLKIAFPDIPEVKILQPDDPVNGGKSRD